MKLKIEREIGKNICELINNKIESGQTDYKIKPGSEVYSFKSCDYQEGDDYISVITKDNEKIKLFIDDILNLQPVNGDENLEKEIKRIVLSYYKSIFSDLFSKYLSLKLIKHNKRIKLDNEIVSYFGFDKDAVARNAAGVIIEEKKYDYGEYSGKHYYANCNTLAIYMIEKLLSLYGISKLKNRDFFPEKQVRLYKNSSSYNYFDFFLRYIDEEKKANQECVFIIVKKGNSLLLTYSKKWKDWIFPGSGNYEILNKEINNLIEQRNSIKSLSQQSISQENFHKAVTTIKKYLKYSMKIENDEGKIKKRELIESLHSVNESKQLTSIIKKLLNEDPFLNENSDELLKFHLLLIRRLNEFKISNISLRNIYNNSANIRFIPCPLKVIEEINFCVPEKIIKNYYYVFYCLDAGKNADEYEISEIVKRFANNRPAKFFDINYLLDPRNSNRLKEFQISPVVFQYIRKYKDLFNNISIPIPPSPLIKDWNIAVNYSIKSAVKDVFSNRLLIPLIIFVATGILFYSLESRIVPYIFLGVFFISLLCYAAKNAEIFFRKHWTIPEVPTNSTPYFNFEPQKFKKFIKVSIPFLLLFGFTTEYTNIILLFSYLLFTLSAFFHFVMDEENLCFFEEILPFIFSKYGLCLLIIILPNLFFIPFFRGIYEISSFILILLIGLLINYSVQGLLNFYLIYRYHKDYKQKLSK